jgi:cytochrome c oxidase subunit 4
MAHNSSHSHGHNEDGAVQQVVETHHIIEPSVYLKVFAALTVLFILTVLVAFFDISERTGWAPANIVIALIIAFIKATIIVLYFMHVKFSSRLTQMFCIMGLVWLMILFIFAFGDYFSRSWIPQPGSWTVPGGS